MPFPCCAERVHHACAEPSGPHSAWILPVPSPALTRPLRGSPAATQRLGTAEPGGPTWPAVVGHHGSPVGLEALGRADQPRRPARSLALAALCRPSRSTAGVAAEPLDRGRAARPVAHHRRGRPAASRTGSTCRCPQLCGTPWTAEAQFRRDTGSSSTGGPVDTSRSCPQECAQVGEIRPDAGPGRRTSHGCGRVVARDFAADLGFPRFGRDKWPGTAHTGRPSCTRHGDEQWATRGVEVDEQRSLCTAVELSTCRQRTDADHPQRANRPGGHLTCGKGPGPQLPHV